MRVISGKAKGKRLKAPPGMDTRPITDMIKEALFNILGNNIENADFLDLFAGSGSVGLEALSRDADRVIFVDNSPDALKAVKENLEHCNFLNGYEIYKSDVFTAIKKLRNRSLLFDYIYIDPPFTQADIFSRVMLSLDETVLLKDTGTLIIRTPKKMDLRDDLKNLARFRINNYGESNLSFYRTIKEVNNDNGDSAYFG